MGLLNYMGPVMLVARWLACAMRAVIGETYNSAQ